ncbi:glycoside hydrolase family 99-like domain-containing protein [Butyrivibrio sp. MC2013]|uniref:glycoside hydrolase family 99-like domain-containing protein n=1 Tax=Butyrivibrio sp. MC2013 TaxID=1280686 RepID=UPI00047CF55E|nr:glycoside hydrolase family 99-like domain-containing protein [Butyrivibrio sp. MC2013]
MRNVKIIANYLPQYHETAENNKWWGKGYTDWKAVKDSIGRKIPGHRDFAPLNDNYYDLSKADTIRWQADLAREYGIYGFGIYHYWINSSQNLLTTPPNILLDNPDIDIHFLFIWDNCSWKRTWSVVPRSNSWAPAYDAAADGQTDDGRKGDGILARLEYGDEKDWEAHFNFLLPFFKDPRYIRVDNKPLFIVFKPQIGKSVLYRMMSYMDKRSREEGLGGIAACCRENHQNIRYDYLMRYAPFDTPALRDYLHYKLFDMKRKSDQPGLFDYDGLWKRILKSAETAPVNSFLSGFVSYDDSPRRGMNAKIVVGAAPHKFEAYLNRLLDIAEKRGNEYIFLTAWNEWGEGAYLEPDKVNGYSYLEALKKALSQV